MAPIIATAFVDQSIGHVQKVLNAWHAAMREMLVASLDAVEQDEAIGAIVITGAGQDLNETKTFDPDRAAL